jgi:excinuclease UvrABC nuclease subunit
MRVPLTAWRELPNVPGIYLFYGAEEKLLYIGKSVRVRDRVRSYLRTGGGHSTQTERLKFEAQVIEVQPTGSELAALILENRLIKEQLPPFNQAQRRWKHYPFLRLDLTDPFPKLEVTRELAQDGAEYFGPYREKSLLQGLVKQLNLLLGLRSCRSLEEIHQGCLLDQMGRCSAPCRGWIVTQDYHERLQPLRHLLMGEGAEVLVQQAKQKMLTAAQQEQFEQAARWRDRLKQLKLFVKQQTWRRNQVVLDVCAVYPTANKGEAQVFWIRGGLLQDTQLFTQEQTPDDIAQALTQSLAPYREASLPMYRLPQQQLDEFHLIASWLYHNRQAPTVFWLQPDQDSAAIQAHILSTVVG